ncbi:MAG TPA: hypothetical protein EYH00_01295 [Archaeoglobus profundus]|nr:hypothetical protein [Archaeoglobus profundus]
MKISCPNFCIEPVMREIGVQRVCGFMRYPVWCASTSFLKIKGQIIGLDSSIIHSFSGLGVLFSLNPSLKENLHP